jgi:hypothetical protein
VMLLAIGMLKLARAGWYARELSAGMRKLGSKPIVSEAVP